MSFRRSQVFAFGVGMCSGMGAILSFHSVGELVDYPLAGWGVGGVIGCLAFFFVTSRVLELERIAHVLRRAQFNAEYGRAPESRLN